MSNYEEIKNDLALKKLSAAEEEIILLDVQRSLFLHQNIISQKVKKEKKIIMN